MFIVPQRLMLDTKTLDACAKLAAVVRIVKLDKVFPSMKMLEKRVISQYFNSLMKVQNVTLYYFGMECKAFKQGIRCSLHSHLHIRDLSVCLGLWGCPANEEARWL